MRKFSIIMAAYNAEQYIKDAVDSIINQTFSNWELIIIDDGSTDKTSEQVDNYALRDDRIKVIHQKNSGTAASARNTALEIVTGQYTQMVDSDDVISRDLLEKYDKKLDQYDLDIIIPDAQCFMNDTFEDIYWKKSAPYGYEKVIDGENGFCLSLDWTIHGVFLVRTSLLKKIRYDPQLINGDEFTTRKLLYAASKIGFSNSIYYYRYNITSTTKNHKNRARMFECLLTDKNILEFALEKNMKIDVINLCKKKLTDTFCAALFIYSRGKNTYSSTDKEHIESILEEVYLYINYDIWKHGMKKHKFLFCISFGKLSVMNKFVDIFCKIKAD